MKRFGLISAGMLAMGLSMATGAVALAVIATPAFAQATLNSAQIAAIQNSLQSALAAAHSDDEKQAAISQAILTAIGLYGSDAASAITTTVMQTAEAAGVSSSAIGAGLAQASASLASATNTAAANAVATTVANEGNAGERVSYQTTTTSLGYTNLASIAGSNPAVTGGIANGTTGGNGTQGGTLGTNGGGGGGGVGGCLNPSCTSL